MKTIRNSGEMQAWSLEQRGAGKSIGLVPTMGAFHKGHLSLMKAAVERDDVAVVSIFVNPTQFAPHEDYGQYPRAFESDCAGAERLGIDVVYAPEATDMYPERYATYVAVERLQHRLCGISRPHFFRGVTTVVTKLFHAVLPNRAYFGQKDGQQCSVIRRMTRDLDFGIEIVELPILRDPDGLAMSSRNAYLSADDRKRALCLSQSLFKAQTMLEGGERNPQAITDAVKKGMAEVDIDYVELVDADELTPVERIEGTVLLAVAARVGKARLIDNIKYEVK